MLVGTPILTGSLIRLILGIWADQHGGRAVFAGVMVAAALVTWLLTYAYDYPTFLIAALPTATWYEKNDLNTSDMHPFIHPLTAAVDPVWGRAERLGDLQVDRQGLLASGA